MTQDFLNPPRRRPALVLIIVVLIILGGVAVLLIIAPHRGNAVAGPGEPRPAASGSPADDGVVTAAPAPASDVLHLVRGTKTVSGITVGYPRTPAGAVSAAVEYWTQLGSTLDPDRARQVGQRVAAQSWKTAGDDLAAGPVNSRRQLGLPVTGPLPPGASISLGPVAYQLRVVRDDRMTVLLLAYMITTTPAAGTQSRIGVFPAPLRWDGGDWRIEAGDPRADYQALRVPPGSAEAVAAGWRDFLS